MLLLPVALLICIYSDKDRLVRGALGGSEDSALHDSTNKGQTDGESPFVRAYSLPPGKILKGGRRKVKNKESPSSSPLSTSQPAGMFIRGFMRRSLERIKPSVAQPRAASTNDVTDGKSVAVSKEKKKRLSSVKEIKDILDCDRPADVYCRFHDSESVLCFAKLPGGDFTDVFYHHLRSNKTQSCQVLTYPSYHAKKGECYKNPAKLEAKWTEAVEEANTSSKGWEKSKARDIEKFRHLIPLQCDIDIEGISFDVSAIYVKFPTAFNGTLSIAFFKSPEEPYKILEFTRAYPTHLARYELRYHSLEPPIDIGAGTFGNLHMRAHVSYDGKKIDVTLPKDYVFFFKTSSGEQSGSKDQMFIFLLGEYNKTFAVMKFGDKWALMTDEAVTER